jgi:hypothetical protein
MSLFGIIMDAILMLLLIAALAFGVRLDRRLKALKAGQEDFARAVADLDQAAIKAHESLSVLHDGADESQELLHGRIMVARDLIQKLDQKLERAERLQIQLERTAREASGRETVGGQGPQTTPEPRVARDVELASERILRSRQPEQPARRPIPQPAPPQPVPVASAPRQSVARPAAPQTLTPMPGQASEADRLELLRQAIRANRLDVVDAESVDTRPDLTPSQEPRPMHRPAMRTRRMVLERETKVQAPQTAPAESMDDRLRLTETALAELNDVLGSLAAEDRAPQAHRPAVPARPASPRRTNPGDDLFDEGFTDRSAPRRSSPGDF